MKKILNHTASRVGGALLILWLINIMAQQWHMRIDLTQDKRYTLSEVTLQTLAKINYPLQIDVLLNGDIPTEFRKLQVETMQLLDEYAAQNSHLIINYINPMKGEEDTNKVLQENHR